jgi:hypothetical protein
MFYLNEKLIQETPGAPDATYGETSKGIDAGWRARFHARYRFEGEKAARSQKKAMTLCQIKKREWACRCRQACRLCGKCRFTGPAVRQ